jgi:hypothetical protein
LDYPIYGGYNIATMIGITSGTIGYTFQALGYEIPFPTDPELEMVEVTGGSHNYTVITVLPLNGQNPQEFINSLSERENFKIAYAVGTTSENSALVQSDPSGNNSKYYILEDKQSATPGQNYNPFHTFQTGTNTSPKNIFTAINTQNANAVDILFLDANPSNMNSAVPLFGVYNGFFIALFDLFEVSGLPSNFIKNGIPLIYSSAYYNLYRSSWHSIHDSIFPSYTTGQYPSTSPRGWYALIGLTGGQTFQYTTNGNVGTIGVTFSTTTGVTGMKQFCKGANVTGVVGNESFISTSIFSKSPNTSAYALEVGGSNDEISIAVVDTGGKFGPKNAVLERFELLSKAKDAKNLDNVSIFYKDYINTNSNYVYMTKPFGLSGGGNATSEATTAFGDLVYSYKTADGKTYTRKGFYESQLAFGESSQTEPTFAEKSLAYSVFADDESAVDILFLPESSVENDNGSDQSTLEGAIYDSVIDTRKDTILVIPTPKPAGNNVNSTIAASKAVTYRNDRLNVPSNSYTILVAGRKLYFDTFNNQIRRMSLASDVAGILSAQEIPWESPAGFARGMLKNSIRLETKYSKADRDELYKNQINFFQEFNDGSGTALFGDKTLLVKPSAFDRINVRRIFIYLEKAIAAASKYSLFEFNDEFTRAQFRNLVIPFLRTVQSQRGISDYKVVCDSTNNTPDVIDRNQFVADIYIKPLKSINFIQLNFIATRSDFNITVTE